jgi:hypothetical protein
MPVLFSGFGVSTMSLHWACRPVMDTFSGAGVHDVSTAIVLPSLRFSSVPRISRRHEDMSTTSDPRNSTAYGAGDQENRRYARVLGCHA